MANRHAVNLCSLGVAAVLTILCSTSAFAQTIEIRDYLTMPMTGSVKASGKNGQLARINAMHDEPGGAGRFFVNDLNGPLWIIDKKSIRRRRRQWSI